MILLSALTLLSGCNLKTHAIPAAPLPFASVDYTVLGATSAEACGTYIFGIDFGHGFFDQSAYIYPTPVGFGNNESRRALYDALEKMPEATNLYAPRIETRTVGITILNYPIFGRRCATVEAHGVKVGTGPVPNAN